MKLISTRPQGFFWIHWWLTNHCNYNCSYCADILKSGSIIEVSISDCLDFVYQANRRSDQLGLKLRIDISGGEITGWHGLNELLTKIKEYKGYASIRTNGSQSSKEFLKTISLLDSITIDYHPEYASSSHYINLIKLATDRGIIVNANINMTADKWKHCERLADKIKNNYPTIAIHRRMLFQDPINNTKPMVYAPKQKEKLVRQHGDLIYETDQGIEYTDYQTIIIENKNNFKGWSCSAGLEQVIVDAYGRVRRGHCGVSGSIGIIGGPISWDQSALICSKPLCVNAFDMQATKVKLQ